MRIILGFFCFAFLLMVVLGFLEVLFKCGGISQEALYECHHREYVEFMENH